MRIAKSYSYIIMPQYFLNYSYIGTIGNYHGCDLMACKDMNTTNFFDEVPHRAHAHEFQVTLSQKAHVPVDLKVVVLHSALSRTGMKTRIEEFLETTK